ncbi:uncharacterized protein IL334_001828 [Kwoniella shivajii]|uniref:FAS1 domain-containing protein n=1 Tax=Kwoniella shivajii TaxID=564305 RepID=A0ABZ1CT92_9TREE|nr:hypothetical protein IL334_001828 [Kwoniella shivajii]
MAGRIPRLLRLHTLPGQLVFLSTVSVIGGWGITQLRDPNDLPLNKSKGKGKIMPQNELVDAIQSRAGSGSNTLGAQGSRGGGITLADALTAERGASLWWNYARDNASITGRLVSRDRNSTLLVPIDKAILGLSRKPHTHPGLNYKGAFASSKINTERFLSAHIIDGLSESGKLKTMLDGFSVELIQDKSVKGGWKIQPGDIEVLGVKETSNGRIMYLSKVLPY